MAGRTWRAEKRVKAKGTYWLLMAGRNEGRVSLSLGYGVTPEAAASARDQMQLEEDGGTAQTIVDWYATKPERAVEYLLGDPSEPRPAPKVNHPRMPLREYHEKVYAPHRKADRPATWKNEANHWRRVLEAFGDVALRDLEPRAVFRWLRTVRVKPFARRDAAEIDADGLVPAGGNYLRLMRNSLQALLTHAYVEGHLDEHVKLGAIRLRGSTTAKWDKPDPLSLDELTKVLDKSDPFHRALFAVAAGQGLRPSELCRLRWSDVRWSEKLLDVPGTKTTQAKDTIPLVPLVLRELRVFWIAQGRPADGLMFPGPKGKPLKSYKRALTTAAEKAGITRDVFPYLLRASFATIAWSLGLERDTTRRVLRHADEAMLDRVYTRPRPADLVDRVARFDVG